MPSCGVISHGQLGRIWSQTCVKKLKVYCCHALLKPKHDPSVNVGHMNSYCAHTVNMV